MKSIIIALEIKQGKDPSIPRTKTVLVNYLEKEFK
jgi:hypothetical protein